MKSISVYIHIPFCIKKCSYCSFYSIRAQSGIVEKYVDAVVEEINLRKELLSHRKIKTVYFGGGTPSLLNPHILEKIIETLHQVSSFHKDAEITLEVNPETVEEGKFYGFRRIGINRISLGAQSFNDRSLKLLKRVHDSAKIKRAFERLRKIGFENINIDVIMGIPSEEKRDFLHTLEETVKLNPEHISVYSLEYHKNTPLYLDMMDGKITPISKELERVLYFETLKLLKRRGYIHYEISNYSKPGKESRHNLNYWLGGEYIGFGASSVSYFSGMWTKNEEIYSFLEKVNRGIIPIKRMEILSKDKRKRMHFILNLRLAEGVSLEEYRLHDFRPNFIEKLKTLQKMGLIIKDTEAIRLSDEGIILSNEVFSLLI